MLHVNIKNDELFIANAWIDAYAHQKLSYNDKDKAALKHSLLVASSVLAKSNLSIRKKEDGFFFSNAFNCGYLSPFEGLLWRFFKVIPKRLFPYSVKEAQNAE